MSDATQSFKRILVPIDDSIPSEWAAQVGARLAEQLGAQVELLTVVESEPLMGAIGEERAEVLRTGLGVELLERGRLLVSRSVDTITSLRFGSPAEQIIAAANEWDADLIVMRSRGPGRIAQLVLGNTAEEVLRSAPCPVVTVAQAPPGPVPDDNEA